jgi:hypothetical protein
MPVTGIVRVAAQAATPKKVMQIFIEYCGTCNYRPIAATLSLAIREAFGKRRIAMLLLRRCALAPPEIFSMPVLTALVSLKLGAPYLHVS